MQLVKYLESKQIALRGNSTPPTLSAKAHMHALQARTYHAMCEIKSDKSYESENHY